MPGNMAITTAANTNNNKDFAYNKYLLCTACYAMKLSIIINNFMRNGSLLLLLFPIWEVKQSRHKEFKLLPRSLAKLVNGMVD